MSLAGFGGAANLAACAGVGSCGSNRCIHGACELWGQAGFNAFGPQAFGFEVAFHAGDAIGVLLALAGQAQGDAVNERGSAAAPRMGDRLVSYTVDGDGIVGVDGNDGQ